MRFCCTVHAVAWIQYNDLFFLSANVCAVSVDLPSDVLSRMALPMLLNQCAQGWVNNIIFTSQTKAPVSFRIPLSVCRSFCVPACPPADLHICLVAIYRWIIHKRDCCMAKLTALNCNCQMPIQCNTIQLYCLYVEKFAFWLVIYIKTFNTVNNKT